MNRRILLVAGTIAFAASPIRDHPSRASRSQPEGRLDMLQPIGCRGAPPGRGGARHDAVGEPRRHHRVVRLSETTRRAPTTPPCRRSSRALRAAH